MFIKLGALIFVLIGYSGAALSQDQTLSGLARVNVSDSQIADTETGVALQLSLSQGVPYRVFTLTDPARLVLDFKEVDWTGIDASDLDDSDKVSALRMGGLWPGWSRMVADLTGPYVIDAVALTIDDTNSRALLDVALEQATPEAFASAAGTPQVPGWGHSVIPDAPRHERRKRGEGPLTVVLDPGHGGIDPGAEDGDIQEKDLMLIFAKELKDSLLRDGDFEVFLTREDDTFVSLERRVAFAHQIGADVFLSLHADALNEGRARGATIYTLSESASDAASAALSERHNRAEILSGVDLKQSDDTVADVLIDLARLETQPRANQLARAINAGLSEWEIPLHSKPLRQAGFSVLKAPDIPSVLLELGFMSSKHDLENLQSPRWRDEMASAVRDSLKAWRIDDAATINLIRQ